MLYQFYILTFIMGIIRKEMQNVVISFTAEEEWLELIKGEGTLYT